MAECNEWLMTPEAAAQWFEDVYPPREHVERVIATIRDTERAKARAEAAAREAELLAKVEELARELSSIPAPGSNAFIRGTRAAGRRVRKLVVQLRSGT